MSATIELFEQYKQVLGVQADRPAAQALGVKSQTVSNWRTRGSQAEPWLIEKMCQKVGHDAAPWLIRALTEQATGANNRKVWERMGRSLKYRIGAIAVIIGLPFAGLVSVAADYDDVLFIGGTPWRGAINLVEALAGM